jgi:hypothetical protein
MPPSVLQLQSIGIQDVYLTKDPQINVFKYSYYRYVNFATETLQLPLNESASFNKKTSCEIRKRGHLLSKLHLHLKLPALVKNGGTYVCWADSIGYAIFSDPIELEIGGVVVDRIYPQFMDIWDEFCNGIKQLGKNFMLGKSDIYVAGLHNANQPLDLLIPLDFWFTRRYNLALPLLSMYNQDIKINFKLRDYPNLIHYDGGTPATANIIESNVYAEYIYLDEVIVEQFQTQKHMYIIEQTQYHEAESIPVNTSIFNTTLKFNHPVKELFFACAEKNLVDNNNYFVYSKSEDNTAIIYEASLLLDGQRRFDALPEFYYRCVFPDNIHSVIPMKYIYCMPFCLKPEDNQPTGSLNLSRFNDVILSVRVRGPNPECYIYVYAVNYNIVTIENGTFTLEFAV